MPSSKPTTTPEPTCWAVPGNPPLMCDSCIAAGRCLGPDDAADRSVTPRVDCERYDRAGGYCIEGADCTCGAMSEPSLRNREDTDLIEWLKDWRDGQFSPSYDKDGWPIEMHGLAMDVDRLLAEKYGAGDV